MFSSAPFIIAEPRYLKVGCIVPSMVGTTIDDEASLRALIGEPTDVVRKKTSEGIRRLTRVFIERAPLVLLGTSAPDGSCDVSPRGDPPGFVRILDEKTLLLPERPGNRLADSLRNILKNPRVGLLFAIPGAGDTFRVNGRATLTTDQALLEPCAVEGKTPRLGILVVVEEAFTHCSKAFIRSDFWNPARFVDRASLPTSGESHKELAGGDFDAAAYDEARAARYARREGFY
jgi:PPOX class probable FMN-dependent enzyme